MRVRHAQFRRCLPWNVSPSFLTNDMCEGAAIPLYPGNHAHGPGHVSTPTALCTGERLTMRSHMEQSSLCYSALEYLESQHCKELRSYRKPSCQRTSFRLRPGKMQGMSSAVMQGSTLTA